MFRYLLLSVFFVSLTINTMAQQMPLVANFMFNQLIYNPAAAGMQETQFNSNLVSRFQWTGMNGAPVTNMFWADYRFPAKKMALGLNLNYDKFGANRNTDFLLNYAYYVPLTSKWKLSMGLRMGFTSAKFSTAYLDRVWDQGDPVVEASNVSAMMPKAGAGLQLSTKNFYAGFSAPDLIMSDKQNLYGNEGKPFFSKKRNYMMMAGYRVKLSDSYKLYPNLRISYFPDSKVRTDLNLIFEITDYFWAGATYSSYKSHALMAGTHISSRVRFAYAYEFKRDLGVNLNTHEINLMLNLDGLFRKK
jgi:type IX secretion system PorP/SprF family membrane protein